MDDYRSVICKAQKPIISFWTSKIFFIKASNPLLYVCYKLGIHQDIVTRVSIISSIAGGVLLISHSPVMLVIALLLLLLGWILDHVDGGLARVRQNKFLGGMYLDYLGHQLVLPLLFLTFGYGSCTRLDSLWPLLAGAIIALLTINPINVTKEHVLVSLIRDIPDLAYRKDIRRLMQDNLWLSDSNVSEHFSFKQIVRELALFPGMMFYLPLLALASDQFPLILDGVIGIDIRFAYLLAFLVLKVIAVGNKGIRIYRIFAGTSTTK